MSKGHYRRMYKIYKIITIKQIMRKSLSLVAFISSRAFHPWTVFHTLISALEVINKLRV